MPAPESSHAIKVAIDEALKCKETGEGKTILFRAMVAKPDDFPKGYFVPGRMAMTCCAEDMQFLGYACRYEKAEELTEKTWVEITAKICRENFEQYEGEGIVLEASKVEPCAQPEEPVINFAG